MHYRVKRKINIEVSEDDVIITVYIIREWPKGQWQGICGWKDYPGVYWLQWEYVQ
jgi:hypothetical protein